ncbi:MAG: 1-deoxy-D-xylulose-5-phosphate synthase [Bacteroidaceae bacterium]|nr:1-deoxy-D-xylulose-5-phosphate synthase [Bacteroidaceae bacterium]MBP5646665.1 1-deoxy-D-xylulose-5-phosphate synthase [Bacteroidaceae bacterium]
MKESKESPQSDNLLKGIDSPADLKRLDPSRLPQVCDELRRMMIDELSRNPGHFSSSLGTVELTVALHYVFNTPDDRIVWDVGHQAYSHKILTGRRDRFCTNRKLGGLRPFPSPEESEYDTVTSGHASNSISAALGMAVADKRNGHSSRRVVAVIGDGAMGGGLAFEGLNNASSTDNDLLIILNDNNMSISQSVGGLSSYLTQLQTSRSYNTLRYYVARLLSKAGLMNEQRRRKIIRRNNRFKIKLTRQNNMFEGMDIRYFGPVDGHNVQNLVRILSNIKNMHGPKLLHIKTVKGKGYEPAEKDSELWHAPGLFDKETGERIIKSDNGMPPLLQDVFGETLLELMKENSRIIGVTPAMPIGCSMNIPMKTFPKRCFDVGIAEGHAVTFSAGLASEGMVPFCNIYSSFLQRAYDNVIHDVAISRLNVVLCLDRAGLVGEDGPTHHGAFDLAFLRPIPNLTIASPYDEIQMRNLMYTAQLPDQGPFVIRYPRGRGILTDWEKPFEPVVVGTGRKLKDGEDVAVLTIGPIGNLASHAIGLWEERNPGRSAAHYDMRFLKPIDTSILHEVGKKYKRVITVENGVITGGMGSAVMEFMAMNGYTPSIVRLGLPDRFVTHGSVPQLLHLCNLDEDAVIAALNGDNFNPQTQET